jgi:mRNA-degrading endonuclease toxin of MazEF toxin-antitoxin module
MVEEVLRGEVYWGRLDPVIGSEMAKTRPVLIVQNDLGNCAHIRAVDKARLRPGLLATVDEATMARVDDALRASLGLR